jgi:predicted nucleic-acid-binding protein
MPKPVLLDTNDVVHFIQALDMPKFKVVAQTLNNNPCHVPIEVIAETVYILDRKLQNDRQTTAAKLKDFIILQDGLIPEPNAITFGLNLYASSNLDCYAKGTYPAL